MKEKTKEVYAILYKRQLLYDDYMIFLPCYYSNGIYNSDNKSFVDNAGTFYYECDNYDVITSSQEMTYFYDISPRDVTNRYQVDNVSEAMGLFYEEIKKTILIGHIDSDKRIVELFELPFNKVKDLSKSVEYRMNSNEGSINITKTQLIQILREDNTKVLKGKLSNFLSGINSLEKYNKLTSVNSVIMDSSGTKVKYIEVDPNVNVMQAKENVKQEKEKLSFEQKRKNMQDTYKYITSSLVGQDECVQDLLSAIINNENSTKANELIRPLLIGQTGSGKTLFFNLLSEILDRKVVKINCNHIVQSDYQGQDIESVLKRIYLLCDSDIDEAERAIVYLDEIDKLASRGASVSDIGAQQALLNFITGDKYIIDLDRGGMNKITIDSTMMNICAGGTFEGLTFNKPNIVGFESKKINSNTITQDDLIKYGMLPELIGRFDQIVEYNPVTEEMIKMQLTSSELSPLKIKQDYYKNNYHTKIEFSEEFINRVCKEASEKKSGFRGAKQIINNSLVKLNFKLQCESLGDKYVIINENIIDNPNNYKILTKIKKS